MCDIKKATMTETIADGREPCDRNRELTAVQSTPCEVCGLTSPRHTSEGARFELSCRRLRWLAALQLILVMMLLAVSLLTVNWQMEPISCAKTEQLRDIDFRLQLLESKFDEKTDDNYWRIRLSRSVNEPLRTIDNVAILNPAARLVSGSPRQSVGLSLYSTLSRAPNVEPTAEPVDFGEPGAVKESVLPYHRESAVYDEKHESLRAEEQTESHSLIEEPILDDETAQIEIRETSPDLVTPFIESYLEQVSTEEVPSISSSKPNYHSIDPNHYQNYASPISHHRPSTTRKSRWLSLIRRVKAIEHKFLEQTKSLFGHFESYVDPSAGGHIDLPGRYRVENRHPLKLHTFWRKSSWMKSSGNLVLQDGRLHVKLGGLYFVYVQVNYLGPKQRSGYEIKVNGHSRAHCVISDGGKHHGKMSTCYTGVLVHIKPGDTITIHDLESHCVSLLKADRTFFGLIRVAGDL